MSGQEKPSKLASMTFGIGASPMRSASRSWMASLSRRVYAPNGAKRPLVPFPEELPNGLSPRAIRKGYIAVAEWLVKNDRWPDAETRAALLRIDIWASRLTHV